MKFICVNEEIVNYKGILLEFTKGYEYKAKKAIDIENTEFYVVTDNNGNSGIFWNYKYMFKIKETPRRFVTLKKDLPNCPKGAVFKENVMGEFDRYLTDQEVIEGSEKAYSFTEKEIEENSEWFYSIIKIANQDITGIDKYFQDIEDWESTFCCNKCKEEGRVNFEYLHSLGNGEVWRCNNCDTESEFEYYPDEDNY